MPKGLAWLAKNDVPTDAEFKVAHTYIPVVAPVDDENYTFTANAAIHPPSLRSYTIRDRV